MAFASAVAFRQWLAQHHAGHPGIWLKIAKKASGIPTVTYAEAWDEGIADFVAMLKRDEKLR